jgi:phospholipid/cholesterol/gamma-HCH transport system ATP-binding protein
MHKRVGLARAIASSPEIIFFDEPTTGLDPIMTDVINHLIEDCVEDLGATTLTITHDMTSVRAIADKTALLYKGEIIWHGDQAALDASEDPFLHQFIHGLAHGPFKVEGQQLEAALAGLDS